MKKDELSEVLDLLFMSRTRVDSNLQDANVVDALFCIGDGIHRMAKVDEDYFELEKKKFELEKERCRLDDIARGEVIGLLKDDEDTLQ